MKIARRLAEAVVEAADAAGGAVGIIDERAEAADLADAIRKAIGKAIREEAEKVPSGK
jgi:hypothetical protein